MFAPIHYDAPRRQGHVVTVSLTLHLLFLGWILHSPKPLFVAPSEIVKGQGGSSLTRIYFGGRTGVTQAHPEHERYSHQAKSQVPKELPRLAARMQKGNEMRDSLASNGPSAGSLYGSLSYGSISGLEVRPALPVISFDPDISSDLLNGSVGDVVIEITIDSVGNITEMHVLQSLGPAVDHQVLAALEKWHFLPATRNGVPIPSKQDVHYHFPH